MENIGELVKQIAKSKNLSTSQLGEIINTTKQNISAIYKRSTIDSELLLALSEALEYNLFSYYDDKEPIKSFRQKEIDDWKAKIDFLSAELDSKNRLLETKDELITTLNKRSLDQEDIIRLLKEKQIRE